MTPSPVLFLSAEEQRKAPYRNALQDLLRGLRLFELWGSMGWFDISQRYSRAVIGPFWMTLSLAVFVLGLGITYGALFRLPLEQFLPYLTVGMVVWSFISTVLVEGSNVFAAAQVAVKQMPVPISVHVYRVVWRTLIIFCHNAIIMVLMLLANPWSFLLGLIPALVGLAVLTLNAVGIALALGTLGARFRDLPPFMANVVSLLLFVTPILWRAESLGGRRWIALINPFYHLIELVRAPLLGEQVSALTWAVSAGVTAVNLLVAFLLYARFRWRIPYWV